MSKQVMDRIEYLVLLVAEFAAHNRVSEAKAYRYLNQYGALALCDKHYNVMHTLSVEENIQTLREYCQRRGGNLSIEQNPTAGLYMITTSCMAR
ncbi:MAG: DUF3791 domain-containing protein [Prevotella sp.]|nr:DUF3791 domain-containing protein [Prevotella sp.]